MGLPHRTSRLTGMLAAAARRLQHGPETPCRSAVLTVHDQQR